MTRSPTRRAEATEAARRRRARRPRGRRRRRRRRSPAAPGRLAAVPPNRLAMVGLVFLVLLVLVAIFAPLHRAVRRSTERAPEPSARARRPTTGSAPTPSAATCSAGSSTAPASRCDRHHRHGRSRSSSGAPRRRSPASSAGPVDTLIMRITDIFLAIPYIVLAVAIARSSAGARTRYPRARPHRLARHLPHRAGQLPVAQAARVRRGGRGPRAIGRPRIMFRHILPNALQPIIVYGTIAVGRVILAEAALSFLGVGPVDPTPGLGPDGRRGQGRPRERAPPAVLPGHGHLPDRAGLRVRRRRPPRRTGPEARR